MTDKKPKSKKTVAKPIKKSAIKPKAELLKKQKPSVKLKAVAVKEKKQHPAVKVIVAKKKETVIKKPEAVVKTIPAPAEKPVIVKHAEPVAAPSVPVEKKPGIEKPAVVREGKFEVFIPKYKVKQKFHPHLKPVSAKPEEAVAPLQPLAQEVKEVQLRALEIKFPVTIACLVNDRLSI